MGNKSLNELADYIYRQNKELGWWTNLQYQPLLKDLIGAGFSQDEAVRLLNLLGIKEELDRDFGTVAALITSEISEALEADRKGLMDDKLPHRRGVEVELVDAIIRILDYSGRHGFDLDGALFEKLAYNANRADHKIENRLKDGGKSY